MRKAKTYAGVERERERESYTLINNKQAKKLALLSISKADYEHNNAWSLSIFVF